MESNPESIQPPRQATSGHAAFSLTPGTRALTYVCILLLPAGLLHWMLPFAASETLGNDYQKYPIWHQQELLFSLKMGSFPLFVPGFAGGHSAAALTLGQLYHPLTHAAAFMPGYWNGHALEWMTLFRLLSLGMVHVLLYRFLLSLPLTALWSFLLSTITVYNLRMLDLFRYGASLESYTGFLLLCIAIGSYGLKSTRIRGPLFIALATYWLTTSGHPQMVYYGFLGSALYTLCCPFFLRALLPDHFARRWEVLRFWAIVTASVGIGLLLSAAYIVPFYFDFLLLNASRVGQGYRWANEYSDTLAGTFYSFFRPLRADSHGAFGGSVFFLVAALLPLMLFFRRIPAVVWVIWAIAMFAFLHMQGARTPVHYLTWSYLPLASSFRIAGRITMLLPWFLMLLLAWLVHDNSRPTTSTHNSRWSLPRAAPIYIASICVLLIFTLLDSSMNFPVGNFNPIAMLEIPKWVERLGFDLSLITLAILLLPRHDYFPRARVGFLLITATLAQLAVVLYYGTWVETMESTSRLSHMKIEKKVDLAYRQDPGNGLYSKTVLTQFTRGYLEPFLGQVYSRCLIAQDNDDAYRLMAAGRTADQVVIEGVANPEFVNDITNDAASTADRVVLSFSSFNRLDFETTTSSDGFFGLAYPYTGHWHAWLDGNAVPLYRANGGMHAMELPAGRHKLEFRYWSWASFAGVLISLCTVVIVVGVCFCLSVRGPLLALLLTCLLLAASGAYVAWHWSLYHGQSMNTAYSWTPRMRSPAANLAFSKTTHMSKPAVPGVPHKYDGGRGVDGDRRSANGFMTVRADNPEWIVDLQEPTQIGRIVLYEGLLGLGINPRPLEVCVSLDRREWTPVADVTEAAARTSWHLQLKNPKMARYVRVRSVGDGHLALDEVEVYAP